MQLKSALGFESIRHGSPILRPAANVVRMLSVSSGNSLVVLASRWFSAPKRHESSLGRLLRAFLRQAYRAVRPTRQRSTSWCNGARGLNQRHSRTITAKLLYVNGGRLVLFTTSNGAARFPRTLVNNTPAVSARRTWTPPGRNSGMQGRRRCEV